MTVFKPYCLSFWEECTGVLNKLLVENGSLIALIGKISLALPLELEEMMRPYVGKRVGLIRTDIPGKQYLIRVIPYRENSEGGA